MIMEGMIKYERISIIAICGGPGGRVSIIVLNHQLGAHPTCRGGRLPPVPRPPHTTAPCPPGHRTPRRIGMKVHIQR